MSITPIIFVIGIWTTNEIVHMAVYEKNDLIGQYAQPYTDIVYF